MTLLSTDTASFDLLLLIVGVAWAAVAPLIAQGVGSAFQAYGQSRAATTDARTAREIAENEDRRARDLAAQQVAFQESQGDPWTHVSNQVATAGAFDRMATERREPLRITLPGLDPKYQAQRTGGYSYQPTQGVRDMAASARDLVMSGGGRTPTMTNPANYGLTGAQNFRSPTGPTPIGLPPAGADEASLQSGQNLTPAALNYLMRLFGGSDDPLAGKRRASQDPEGFVAFLGQMGYLPGGEGGGSMEGGATGSDLLAWDPNAPMQHTMDSMPWRTSYTAGQGPSTRPPNIGTRRAGVKPRA